MSFKQLICLLLAFLGFAAANSPESCVEINEERNTADIIGEPSMPAPVASERPPEEAQDFMHGLKTASANVRMQRTPMDHGIEVPELEVSLHILFIMLHVRKWQSMRKFRHNRMGQGGRSCGL
jgi:hypothetical protein